MTLSELSIRRPVFAWMLMAALIVFGGIAFTRMGISQLPDVDFPVVNVGLTLSNAAPEVMESDVVDPVEDAVMGIEGIRNVYSNSSQGTANVTIEFELGRDVDIALQEVQTRIAQARRRLPTKLDSPVITKTNPEDQPILWLILTNDGTMPAYKQMMYARNTLKDQFSTIDGVGNIQFGGYVDPNLRVNIDIKKMHQYDLTSADILSAIQAEQVEVPAGRIENEKREFNIRLLGEAVTPEDFSRLMINQRGGSPNYRPTPLSTVAEVKEGLADIRQVSRFNGKEAVGLGIVKQRGSNAVAVAERVNQKVGQVRGMLPKGLGLETELDTTHFIKESVSELNFTLLLSAILTSVVCYIFLGSWSSTINVLFAIPTSIVGAFIVLNFMKFTLNTFTLLGLSLAIGIVVDDAIMMLENIVRHAESGKSRFLASLEGSNEITFAAIAATIAIAAIFIPVVFMKGIVGRFFYQYGITVTVAVLLSLLEALTLTPMRCSQFLHIAHGASKGIAGVVDRAMEKLGKFYRRSLATVIARPKATLGASVAFFLVTMALVVPLRKELIPSQDQSLYLLTIKTPVGSSIQATDEYFKRAETYLHTISEVLDTYSNIGNFNGADIVNGGVIYVALKEPKERKRSQKEVLASTRDELKKLMPDADVYAQDLSLTGFTATRGYPIEFSVQGPDWRKLAQLSKDLIAKMKGSPYFSDVSSDYQEDMPELQIIPDRIKAAARGVSVSSMGTELSTLIGGSIFDSGTQYPQDSHRYDIRVRSKEGEHDEEKDLSSVLLRNNRGVDVDLIPLTEVANVKSVPSYQMISRQNRERAVPVFANVPDGVSQQASLGELIKISKGLLPDGYRLTLTGSAQTFQESFEGLIFALLLGILVAYMVLASQFNSFIHPVTVLMALPFSVSGAFLALFLTHQSLNLFSMIGLILLMGIVKKNSILLVDFTNQKRGEGLGVSAALLEACPIRLRPVVMTSIATVAGAIPAAASLGPGSETRVPMALALIGGVLVSTLLTLYVVPCVYQLLARFERPMIESEDPILVKPGHGKGAVSEGSPA